MKEVKSVLNFNGFENEVHYLYAKRRKYELDIFSGKFCLYFLVNKFIIKYIGQTKNIKTRICNHIASGKRFDMIYVVTFDKEIDLKMAEIVSIKAFLPKLNKMA